VEKTAEPIEMPFGMWTWIGQRNHVLDGVQIPKRKSGNFEAGSSRLGACLDISGGRYTQSDSAGGRTGTVRMPIGVY